MTKPNDPIENSGELRCYLAFVVGEWFAKTVRHLGSQAFDSRELGRAMLTLSVEACSLSSEHKAKLESIKEAGVKVCERYDFGPRVIDSVRNAMVSEASR